MGVISISYNDGGKPTLDYESVNFSSSFASIDKTFDSGDFVKDWYDCIKFIVMELADSGEPISYSSSVNHFIMDGAPYDSRYLRTDGDEPILVEEYHNGIEIFVKENTFPTWAELKVLVGDIKTKE